ncbi:MAG: magnesium/cobalt transporter CorA [Saprospiraceae bacterium]|nr:magnesium/cobalt transporter CorA [Saprospiraceae bacterium]
MAKRKRKNTGLAPGSLVFTGRKKMEVPNISLVQYNAQEILQTHEEQTIPTAKEGMYTNWYDVRGLHHVGLIGELGKRFKVHPLILEDILDMDQRAKFEEFERGLFVSLKAFEFHPETFELSTEQIGFYATQDIVITFQEKDDDVFEDVRKRLNNEESKIRARKSDYLMYALIDAVVDRYFIMLDQIEELMDGLEMEILADTTPKTKSKIHKLKLATLTLRRAFIPMREAMTSLSRSEHVLIEKTTRPFLRDLHDHSIQVMEMLESFRDIMQGLYDLFVSEINFKMNNVMKILTIVSSIFIPLGFLTGLYGMNFEYMPELQWRYSYFVLWGVMLLIVSGLLVFFWNKKWL